MDNGEVVLLGMCDVKKSLWYGIGAGEQVFVAFNNNRGDAWTELKRIADGPDHQVGRPLMLAYPGQGKLADMSGDTNRHISDNYG